MQTIQQQRAAFALAKVEAAVAALGCSSEYKSYASGFPAMIQMNGLGQAAAFYLSKSKSDDSKGHAYKALYCTLEKWLTNSNPELCQPYRGSNDLLNGITESDMQAYMLAQAEALVFLDWVKKFAKVYMSEQARGESDE